jgi:hypothetical protein
MRRLIARLGQAALLFAVLTVLATGALGYFSATGTGTAQATVSTISAPANPTPLQSGSSITIGWSAATLSSGAAVQGYRVRRSDGTNVCGVPTLTTALQCTDSAVPAGTYTYTVTAVYNTWVSAATSGSITVLTSPTLSSTPLSQSATPAPSISFSGGGTGVSYQCNLDGGAFTACTSPQALKALNANANLADGSHAFTVHAVRGSSTGPDSTYTWTINTAAPTLGSKPSSQSANTAPSISFSHAVYASFQCKLDAGSFAPCSSPQAVKALNANANLADGSHTVTVQALDASSVATTAAAYTWTINTAAPTISAQPASTSATPAPSFSFSDSAGSYAFKCKLDGASFTVCASPTVYSAVSSASHTFTVESIDPDGVVVATTASYTWTVNSSAPTITAQPSNPSFSAAASFSFTHSIYTSFNCQLDGGAFGACTSPTVYSALGGGAHTFVVEAIDAQGQASSTASYTWKTGLFFRTAGTAKTTGTVTTLPLAVPAGVVAGDVMIAIVATSDNGGGHIPTAPVSGWTQIEAFTSGLGGYAAYWHLATASEPASYTFANVSGTALVGAMDVYGGENTSAPIQISAKSTGGGFLSPTPNPVAPSVTTTTANALVIVATGYGWGGNPDTAPAGITDRGSISTTSGTTSVTGHSADFAQAIAGATPTQKFTLGLNLSSANWAAVTIALNPA